MLGLKSNHVSKRGQWKRLQPERAYGIYWIYWAHDDVIKWKHFPRYWPFVRGIHRSPVNSPHKGQWRGALMFSLICVWINSWVNNREAGDLRRNRANYDVIVMLTQSVCHLLIGYCNFYSFSCPFLHLGVVMTFAFPLSTTRVNGILTEPIGLEHQCLTFRDITMITSQTLKKNHIVCSVQNKQTSKEKTASWQISLQIQYLIVKTIET